MTDEENIYFLALGLVSGVGSKLAKQLVSYCGSAKNVFDAPLSKLQKIPGVNKLAEKIHQEKSYVLDLAKRQFAQAQQTNTDFLPYISKKYPHRLKNLHDSPYCLFYKGNSDLNAAKSVAIVGTRRATQYGRDVTKDIIQSLKPYNPLIVSGLAYGIDIQAHRSSLKHGLQTVGVMASGMDIIYPATHKKIALQMLECGGLLTEQVFGQKPDAHLFPARNRIIAGMADVTIVVEAAIKGGALITAKIASSYNREVFAVPGRIKDTVSVGCNHLIKSHQANLLTGVSDLEYVLNWTLSESVPKQTQIEFAQALTPPEKTVISALKNSGHTSIDNLVVTSGLPMPQVSSILLSLEFRNLVRSLPGKCFELV